MGLIKKINSKINKLWQSKDENFKDTKIGGIYIFLLSALPLIIIIFLSDNNLDFIRNTGIKIFKYLAFIFAYLSIVLVITHYYVNNNMKLYKWIICIIKLVYKIILGVFIICAIPLLVGLKIIEVILKFRAKKIDNLINFCTILIFDFILLVFFWIISLLIANALSLKIIDIFLKFNIKLNMNFMFLMCLFLIMKFELDMFSKIIITIMKKVKEKKTKKKMEKLGNRNDISHIDITKEVHVDIIKSQEDLEYDLNYYKKSIWKLQLASLIIIFFLAMASVDLFNGLNSEVKDVCTLITLGMLYLDKRKEWK